MDEPREDGSYRFMRWNGYNYEDWTGHFHSEEEAQEWYEHPDRGGFFRYQKNYEFGLFKNCIRQYPDWMPK